jgi:hypothetical protein
MECFLPCTETSLQSCASGFWKETGEKVEVRKKKKEKENKKISYLLD